MDGWHLPESDMVFVKSIEDGVHVCGEVSCGAGGRGVVLVESSSTVISGHKVEAWQWKG